MALLSSMGTDVVKSEDSVVTCVLFWNERETKEKREKRERREREERERRTYSEQESQPTMKKCPNMIEQRNLVSKNREKANGKRTPAGRHAARMTSLMLIAKFCTTSISSSSDNALNICPMIEVNSCCTCALSPVALTQSIKLGVIAIATERKSSCTVPLNSMSGPTSCAGEGKCIHIKRERENCGSDKILE